MDEILGLEFVDRFVMALFVGLNVRLKTERFVAKAFLDDFLKPDERPAADEQDIGRVELLKLLLRMLAPAAWSRRSRLFSTSSPT